MENTEFDCVEMKQRIQRQIIDKTHGLSWDEYCRKTEALILANPLLGPILERARKKHTAAPNMADPPRP